ncbi:MAG: glycosyltransferase [Bacteroidaceae bacterium]|nr:glycosyltransferase [Bacteroidaceae bacterium]
MKKITVITINYNNREGLEKTIRSVISQDYPALEYIVIDGGSTDGSKEVIEKYADKIDFWVSEPDKGIYNAMNKGVSHATGEYVNFMNSGDCMYDSHVVSSIFSRNPTESIIVGRVVTNTGRRWTTPPKYDLSFYDLYSGAIAHQGAFISTALQRKYPYDEQLRIVSDWKFFIQAAIFDNCSFKYVDDLVCRYDTTGISTTNPERMHNEKKEVLRTLLPERIIADYERMKQSECLTQTLTPKLRKAYRLDKIIYKTVSFILRISGK